jgi:6,7-dimethyl-8-ribityllumazine synthase
MKTIEGNLSCGGARFALVAGRFNSFITERLLSGALDALARSGADEANITIVRVPGAWEIPVTVKALANTRRFDAIICLGAVIRGDTPHFEYVAGQSASGLATLALETGLPIVNGILTTNTVDQAIDRAGSKSGNKGFDAAMTAIEMVNLLKQVSA